MPLSSSFHRLSPLAILGFLAVLPTQGQAPAFLVRDLNVDYPKVIVYESWQESEGAGSLFYFVVNDEIHGNEVWRSDGTPAGTFLLKDARPGAYSSYPRSLTGSNGLLFFAAESSGEGPVLWKSDGTPEGTSPVRGDSFPGFGNSGFSDIPMIDAGGRLLFVAPGADLALDLWGTDGTEAGTQPVGDSARGFFSVPRFLAANNGQVLFAADNGSGLEPWVTDGTNAGTHLVADLNPGGGSILTSNPGPSGKDSVAAPWGGFIFAADDGVHGQEIWRTDGTAAGTAQLKDIMQGSSSSSPFGLTVLNGKVIFAATDSVHGREIWVTDGTEAGTLLLQDTWPGSSGSGPREITVVGSQAFFRDSDGTHGSELWATDGTPAGTRMVKDLVPGAEGAFPSTAERYLFASINGRLIFYSFEAGGTFWTSDGTEAGTQPVTSSSGSWPYMNLSAPDNYGVAGGRLFLRGDFDPSIWVIDGTTSGSCRVLDIPLQTSAFNLLDGVHLDTDVIADVGGTLLFQATDTISNYELWRSDGTVAGTWQVKDLTGDSRPSSPDWFRAVNDRLAFSTGPWLGLSDGTEAGTGIVSGLSVLGFAAKPLGNQLFFFSDFDSNPQGLWKTDGTEAGTVLVAASPPGVDLTPSGGKIFYWHYNSAIEQHDLWVSDGTGIGTDIGPGLNPQNLTDAAGTLFFSSVSFDPPIELYTLWKSDGTSAGTVQVADVAVAPPHIGGPFAVLPGGIVLFVADDGTHGRELWRSDGTSVGTVLVKDIRPGLASAKPYRPVVAGSRAFFVADDGVHGWELWTSDGTEAGTHLVLDIVPGAGSSLPYNLAAAGSTLVFTAFDPAYGVEAWRSNGTALGTWRLADVAPGPLSSSPLSYTLSGNNLFFVANDNTTGFELWAIPKGSVLATFGDVPMSHWAWPFIEALAARGGTAGCADREYCPDGLVSRAQAAVFILATRDGVPLPPATGTRFEDVPLGYWAAPWIEELARQGVTSGCSTTPPLYCPESNLTRAQAAVMLTVARHETPPPATGTRFTDVPADYWAAPWIEQLAADGITVGCGDGNYCPDRPTTRDEMAVFLTRAFNLPMP